MILNSISTEKSNSRHNYERNEVTHSHTTRCRSTLDPPLSSRAIWFVRLACIHDLFIHSQGDNSRERKRDISREISHQISIVWKSYHGSAGYHHKNNRRFTPIGIRLYLHVDGVLSGPMDGTIKAESDDEDLTIHHETKAITRPTVTPSTLRLAKSVHHLFFTCRRSSRKMERKVTVITWFVTGLCKTSPTNNSFATYFSLYPLPFTHRWDSILVHQWMKCWA